jgi:hypothetical protein
MGFDPSYENELMASELRSFTQSGRPDENKNDIITVLHMPRHPTANEWALALQLDAGA